MRTAFQVVGGEKEWHRSTLIEELMLVINKYAELSDSESTLLNDFDSADGQALRVTKVLDIVFKEGVYINFTMKTNGRRGSKLAEFVEQMRKLEFWFEFSSLHASTLLLLGTKGTGTDTHIDWTEARNFALGLLNVPGRGTKETRGYVAI
jgi:hypothetical protein